jgi:hypothetical protein
MDGWLALANRGLHDAEILMWNKIIFDWTPRFLIVGFLAALGYVAMRVIRTKDD